MKKTKNKNKTSEISAIFHRFSGLFESFINKPSDPTLAELIDLGKIYKEAWIEQAYNDPEKLSSYNELIKIRDDSSDFEEISSEVLLLKEKHLADEAEYKKIRDLEESEGLNNPSELTMSYKKDNKSNSTKLVIAKEVSKQESPDKKTKIVTQSIFSNENLIADPDSPLSAINFYQHAIRAVRKHEKRFFNRRWYVEKSKDGNGQSPWWADREQHDQMIELANSKGFFQESLDDPRLLGQETKVIFSGDLTDLDHSKYLREITFPSERSKISSNSYYFVIFESRYDKTMDQILGNISADEGNKSTHIWRDVCIFSPNEITYRVITNDKLAKPTIPIEDSPAWSISNDMSHLSNQAMKTFIYFTHPGLKINNLDD